MATPKVRIKMKDIFKSFKVDLRGFYKNRVYVQHHLHIQPSEISAMFYYEYQWMLLDLIEMLKEQNGEGNNQNTANEQMDKMKQSAKGYTKDFGKMPSMGSLGNMKMPKF